MAGLYPDEKVINVFGTEVKFPGLDPNTHKFTNGDFSDPLIKPSFIPAETINLILDNLENVINVLGIKSNNYETDQLIKAIKMVNLPTGVTYRQGAGDYDPYEAGLPGEWALWNERVVTYEMIRESEWNALFSATPNYWTISESIPINQYRIWTPMGSTVSGTRRIIRANTAINSVAPKQINPIYWNDLPNIIYSFRRELHTRWDDDDLMIGGAITYNGQQMRIVGILTPSGLFESFAGGNRPPFGGGIDPDRSRRLVSATTGDSYQPAVSGPSSINALNYAFFQLGGNGAFSRISFDSSLAVPTGNDNAPITATCNLWRKVS